MALKKHTLNFIIFQNLLLLLSMAIMIIINCISCSLNQHWKHFVKTWVTWDTFKILSLSPFPVRNMTGICPVSESFLYPRRAAQRSVPGHPCAQSSPTRRLGSFSGINHGFLTRWAVFPAAPTLCVSVGHQLPSFKDYRSYSEVPSGPGRPAFPSPPPKSREWIEDNRLRVE